jgi:hypothetical protein
MKPNEQNDQHVARETLPHDRSALSSGEDATAHSLEIEECFSGINRLERPAKARLPNLLLFTPLLLQQRYLSSHGY